MRQRAITLAALAAAMAAPACLVCAADEP